MSTTSQIHDSMNSQKNHQNNLSSGWIFRSHHSNNSTMLKRNEQKPDMYPEADLSVPGNVATKSPSSGSHSSSGSSFYCSTGAKESHFLSNTSSGGNISPAEQSSEVLKRALSDAQLPLFDQDKSELLIRSQIQKIFNEPASLKAIFGEENIRFSLQPHWGFTDLHRKLLRCFCINDVGRIDLEECVDIHRLPRALVAHQPSAGRPQLSQEQIESIHAILHNSKVTHKGDGPSFSVATKSGKLSSPLISWIVDSGATNHMTSNLALFDYYEDLAKKPFRSKEQDV